MSFLAFLGYVFGRGVNLLLVCHFAFSAPPLLLQALFFLIFTKWKRPPVPAQQAAQVQIKLVFFLLFGWWLARFSVVGFATKSLTFEN